MKNSNQKNYEKGWWVNRPFGVIDPIQICLGLYTVIILYLQNPSLPLSNCPRGNYHICSAPWKH